MRLWWAMLVLISAGYPIGPVVAQTDPAILRAAAIGPAGDLPGLWGAPTLAPEPEPEIDLAFTPPPVEADLSALPPLATPVVTRDLVSAVVVAATAYTPGPAWWRISDSDSTVWIMGTPDRMPLATSFDDRALAARIAQARQVILPASPLASGVQAAAITGRSGRLGLLAVDVRAGPQDNDEPPPDSLRGLPLTTLAERLPPDLLAELGKRIAVDRSRAPMEAKQLAGVAPSGSRIVRWAPNEVSATLTVAARLSLVMDFPGPQGNPAVDRAFQLAKASKAPVVRLENSATDLSPSNNILTAPLGQISAPVAEPLQQDCLRRVLATLDAGQIAARRQDELDDWVIGDAVHAMRRANVVSTCDFGPAGAEFWTSLVNQNVLAIWQALQLPGTSVAIVEFDPLLVKGGVVDQLKGLGYAVTPPEGM